MIFFAKKDIYYILAIILLNIILYLPAIFFTNDIHIVYYIISPLISLFLISTLFLVYYKIDKENKILTMQFLFIKFEIKIERITKLERTKNLKLSFATSFKRLKICYGLKRETKKTTFYISPKKEDEFLNCITSINKNLEVLD